jgi:hypothetical protein
MREEISFVKISVLQSTYRFVLMQPGCVCVCVCCVCVCVLCVCVCCVCVCVVCVCVCVCVHVGLEDSVCSVTQKTDFRAR